MVGRGDTGGAAAAPPGGDGGLRELMQVALAAQMAGNLDEAQRLYRGALEISPDNVDALHMLGVVHFSKGELELAEALIVAAEALSKGTIPAISYNLSLVRHQAAFLRGEKAIRSMLDAADYRRRMGLDVRGDAIVERTTRLIAFYLPQFHRIAENDLSSGLHRVGRRSAGVAEFQGALPAARARRDGLLRPRRRAGGRTPGGSRQGIRDQRVLLLLLLVRGPAAPRNAHRPPAAHGQTGLPLLPVLGQ